MLQETLRAPEPRLGCSTHVQLGAEALPPPATGEMREGKLVFGKEKEYSNNAAGARGRLK